MEPNAQDLDELVKSDTGLRSPSKPIVKFMAVIAIVWAVYQIYVASPFSLSIGFLRLNDTEQRAIHLAFAVFLAFLSYPAFAKSPRRTIPLIDWALACVAAFCCLYLVIFYEDVVSRSGGTRTTIELIVSLLGLACVLEITRRSLGMSLVIVALVFSGYAFFGQYMPDFISHRGASLNRFVDHMWLTTEGVFGLPLGVSNSFIFLFVLFGSLLDKAGAGNYFIQLSFALLGHLRGGPAKAAVVSSGLTGMISGSAIANIVTTGTFTIPLMKRIGFSGEKAAAIEVSSSINGQIMPPVMGAAAFLMTEFVGISYFEVVKHAFIPAILSYCALFYIVHLEAVKADMPILQRLETSPILKQVFGFVATIVGILTISMATYYFVAAVTYMFGKSALLVCGVALVAVYLLLVRFAAQRDDIQVDDPNAPLLIVPAAMPILLRGLHYVIPIGVLIWCLMIERLSPGLSVFWAIMTVSTILVTQKPLFMIFRGGQIKSEVLNAGIQDLGAGLVAGAKNMVAVTVAMAAAGIIVGVVSLTGVGLVMSGVIDTLSGGNVFLMLIVTALICITLGMGLPTTANYIVVASIMAQPLVTLAAQNGVVIPLIAVHLFVFYFGLISGTTPPVAVDAFAGAAVAQSDPMKTCIQSFFYSLRTAILPFVFVFNPELLLIGISSWAQGFLVVGVSLIAVLVFSSATQGYFLIRSRRWESAALLIIGLSLLRPDFWLDRFQPAYRSIGTEQITEIIGELPSDATARLLLEGENFSGRVVQKIILLPLGPQELPAEARLFDHGGLSLESRDGAVEVEDIRFGSPAQLSGIDYGWQVLEMQVENDRMSKFWLYVPFLLLLCVVVMLQSGRRRTADSAVPKT